MGWAGASSAGANTERRTGQSATPSTRMTATQPTTKATLRLPDADSERKVKVVVVSDSYIGMEWSVEDVEVPAPPKVADGLKNALLFFGKHGS